MLIRLLMPFVAVVLFLFEPVLTMFSPIEMFGSSMTLVPRFLFMYLLFIAVYYDRKKSLIYAILFGILYDVVYIDIVGLYSVLFPLFCVGMNKICNYIQQTLPVVTILTVVFVALLELVAFEFYRIVSITNIPVDQFLMNRLLPTIVANFLLLILLGWLFKYLIKTRKLQSV